MEAMCIETLLLSAWEEGFVGKTRVPLDQSDVDVLVSQHVPSARDVSTMSPAYAPLLRRGGEMSGAYR